MSSPSSPLGQLFELLDRLPDGEVVAEGRKIDWATPETVLWRYQTSSPAVGAGHPNASLGYLWPVQALLRCPSARVRRLLLDLEINGGLREWLHVDDPTLRNLRPSWHAGVNEALARFDTDSLKTLLAMRTTEEKSGLFWLSGELNPLMAFGRHAALGNTFDPIAARACLDVIFQTTLESHGAHLRALGWKGEKRLRERSFKRDFLGTLACDAILRDDRPLFDFAVKEGATLTAQTVIAALSRPRTPVDAKWLSCICEGARAQNGVWAAGQVQAHGFLERRFSDSDPLEQQVENHLLSLINTQSRLSPENRSPAVLTLLHFIMDDGLVLPGFDGICRRTLAFQMSLLADQPDAVLEALLVTHNVAPSAKEVAFLSGFDPDRAERRMKAAPGIQGILPLFIQIFNQSSRGDENRWGFLEKHWDELCAMDGDGMTPTAFAREARLDEDQTLRFCLSVENHRKPAMTPGPKMRI
jgi:hypothetical protein